MIQIFTSNKAGPNLVVMAGVHGDEPCGLEAFADILHTLLITKGMVTFVIGNPKAVAKHKRVFNTNLNRMFRSDSHLSDDEKGTYEYVRSRELMPILASADALLDIHSTATPESTPFAICESLAHECAQVLPVQTVLSGIDALHPTGTDAFVNQSGGLGICIECGNHDDVLAKDIAVEAIMNFLHFFGVIDRETQLQKSMQSYMQAEWLYANKNVFTLSKQFSEFEKVTEGARIGVDGTDVVVAPYDGFIVFPQSVVAPDGEAFVYCREILKS